MSLYVYKHFVYVYTSGNYSMDTVLTIRKVYFYFRSGKYQTVIEGYDNEPSKGDEDPFGLPLFGELYSNTSDDRQIFVNQNIITNDNKIEISSGDNRYLMTETFYYKS